MGASLVAVAVVGCCILSSRSPYHKAGDSLFTGYMLISFESIQFGRGTAASNQEFGCMQLKLVVLLGPRWIFFEYLNFRSLLARKIKSLKI